jgi:anaerobic selenocysteine-containing dehydrogenase
MLGAGLLGNVLDVVSAREALDKADLVVVAGHGGAGLAYADVVLPAAVQHERLGTVTNIEGRVTAVAPKIVAPGSAWPDVAIASELAEELGQSIGLSSVEQAAKAIEETTGYPALSVLNDSTSDGVVVGDVAERSARRPLDPMAFPGIRSTEAVGLGANAGTTFLADVAATSHASAATLAELGDGAKLEVPLADAYSLRVNLSHRLYDNGIAVQGSPSLATLKAVSVLLLNHFDLDRMGVATGDEVGVSGARGSIRLPVALDDAVPRGVVEIAFGSLDADGVDVVRPILDGGDVISQVRLESA